MSSSGDIYTDNTILAQTRPARDNGHQLKRKHESVIYEKTPINFVARKHSDKVETASDKPRIEQGSNRDRTRIEQGQKPCLMPALSRAHSASIPAHSEAFFSLAKMCCRAMKKQA